MSFEGRETGLDYAPCRYGKSRVLFRGPRVALDDPYTAVIGGSEVYGKYVADPFTWRLADRTGRRVVNLGLMNGGIDVFTRDEALLKVVEGAETVIVHAMGAHNLSNRFYTVHPRRNDRFLKHSAAMEGLYRDVDFSEFTFTRHMLTSLRDRCAERFTVLQEELTVAWTARMRLLLSRAKGRRVLLWIENEGGGGLGSEPLFVTAEMMQQLEGSIEKVVHCDVSDVAGAAYMEGMVFPETDHAMAARSLTPPAHERIATALIGVLRRADGLAA